MAALYRSLLLLIAGATNKELARQLRYLKEENRVLRGKMPDRITVTRQERSRLLKFGAILGCQAIRHLVTIVHPDTFLRWVRDEKRDKKKTKSDIKRGRPKTKEDIRKLILKFAKENGWGYGRIMGELKKLGINPPSRNTIKNILKAAGFAPGPNRGEGTWDEFLKRHAASLWQIDFFSKKVLTVKGFRELYVLVFLHVQTRRVYLTPASSNPGEAWVQSQTHEFLQHAKQQQLPVKMVMHDRDAKFSKAVDGDLRKAKIKVLKTAFRAPNTNAYVERFVQSIEQECLDHFVVFGEAHLDHLCKEYQAYYHTERPHQSKDNELLAPQPAVPKRKKPKGRPKSPDLPTLRDVHCRERLGGLLKHYYRKAA